VAQYAAYVKDVNAREEAFMKAVTTVKSQKERKAIEDTFDWSPNRQGLERGLSGGQPTMVENAYRATYLGSTFDADSIVAKESLTTIPASSPLWSVAGLSGTIGTAGELETYKAFVYEVLRENPSDKVKARILLRLLNTAEQNDETEKTKLLYSWMAAEYEDRPIMRLVRRRYAPDRAVEAGKPVPDFAVEVLRDTTTTFTPASFEGQYVLLDFWATWCAPCIDELPTLRKVDSTYGGDDFAILSLSLDASRSTVTDFLEDRKMPWKHAFAEEGFGSEVANQFEVVGIPKPVLVGPDGRIVATESELRGEALMTTLEKHLGPPGAAAGAEESN
jgi:thiol-disulfide isomerase/thioredoxin